jgi:FAD/FMN-containing dehydrogenase/Fe-S oxidoreductase
LDERRARIYDDLRGLIEGELYFAPLDRAPYAHDASLYEIDPLGVIVPGNEEDVLSVVRYAAEHQIPLHPRGAGTDTGGGSLGAGLVIDLSQHLRQVIEIGSDHVVVEAGVVLDALNAKLAPLRRRMEPVTGDSEVSTVGGMIAVDAAGGRSLRYGSMGDHVERLRVVFGGGEVGELGFEPWRDFEAEPTEFIDVIVRKLHAIYRRSVIRLERVAPQVARNRAGYALARAADESGVHLGRLVAGSEGTLAIVVQAVLKTVPLPAAEAVVLLGFVSISQAAAFAAELCGLKQPPTACDLFDRRSLSLAREADSSFRDRIGDAAESLLAVGFEGEDDAEIAAKVRLLRERAVRSGGLALEPFVTNQRDECESILSLRRLVEPYLMRNRGRARPVSVLDDIAVPLDQFVSVLQRLQNLFQQENFTWAMDAYVGDGRLRVRPFLDLSSPAERQRLESLACRVYEIVLESGGTISSAQGCGLARTQFVRKQYGELVQVFREIKDAFDPMGQLNPGKVVGDEPHLMTRNLREGLADDSVGTGAGLSPGTGAAAAPALGAAGDSKGATAHALEPSSQVGSRDPGKDSGLLKRTAAEAEEQVTASGIEPALRWPELSLAATAAACNGCGMCRTLDPLLRMCPSFRATRREAASPRSQANLIRQLIAGAVDPRLWGSEELKAHADLCLHCKLCQSECPAAVNVSSLMVEAKAAYVESHGLTLSDWIFSRIELWTRVGSRLPTFSNLLFSRRGSRWLLERLLGISRHRVLPRVRSAAFTHRAARLGLTKARPQTPGPRVVYFLDFYANYYDHELAEAVVGVLRQAGVNVFLPYRQRASGMAALLVGDIDYAREQALANLRVLANAVRDGYTVVCSEPAAALMMRQEYVRLTEDLDAELVAANTMDVGQYLLGLEARGHLPAPRERLDARVGYHQPCHQRALGVGKPGLELLQKVLQLDVEFIDRGCSGMGGTFGMERDRFWTSLRAGRGLRRRLRDADIEIGATECAACRVQMEQGVSKRTLHPVKLLSLAYGLNPALRAHFKDPKSPHVMT